MTTPHVPNGADNQQPQAPQHGYPQQQPQPQRSKTNTLSYIALILAFVAPIAGAIVGHISLKQIKTSGEEGHGMALAGVIIGWILTAMGAIYLVLVIIGVIATINSSELPNPLDGDGPTAEVCTALENLSQLDENIYSELHLFDELSEAYADQPEKQRATDELKAAILSGVPAEMAEAGDEFDKVTGADQLYCVSN